MGPSGPGHAAASPGRSGAEGHRALGDARTSETHRVTEGVETQAEVEVLAWLRVELTQGYLLAHPAPLEELIEDERAA